MTNPTAQVYLSAIWVLQGLQQFLSLHASGRPGLGYFWNAYVTIWQIVNYFISFGVILIVIVQHRLPGATGRPTSKKQALGFEVAKSVLVTVSWLWLLLNAIFSHRSVGWEDERKRAIIGAAVSSIYPM